MAADKHPTGQPAQPGQQALDTSDPSLPKAVLYWCALLLTRSGLRG